MIPSLQRVAVGIADMPVARGQASLNVFGEKIGCPFRPGPFVEYLEAERPT
jgi:hypothetical protein